MAQTQIWTVNELLAWTIERFERSGIASPRTDAEHLLAHALHCTRLDLYVKFEDAPDAGALARYRGMVQRRLAREPVAYIEGRRGFHALDLDLVVDRRVLIPRPETEHLVDWVLEDLRPPPAPPTSVLDVGTGSGAIALAIKRARDDVRVLAVDASADALAVARANSDALGIDVELARSDLLEQVIPPQGGFTAVAANLPYVPSEELESLEPEVRDHEPRAALDGGSDGLDVIRRLIHAVGSAETSPVLAPGGRLYLEVGIGQAGRVCDLLRTAGMANAEARQDLSGIDRVVRGTWPHGADHGG